MQDKNSIPELSQEDAMMLLGYLSDLNSQMSGSVKGRVETEQETLSLADSIYGELVKQYQPYIDATDIIPMLVPMAEKVLSNLKTLRPVYDEVNNFFKQSVHDSVLDAYKAAYKACDSNVGVALELTKLMVGQSNRLNELLKASIDEAKKNSSKS